MSATDITTSAAPAALPAENESECSMSGEATAVGSAVQPTEEASQSRGSSEDGGETDCPERVTPGGLVLIRIADVQPEPVTWLWHRRLPRGKLALLVGDPEAGKSFVSLDVAARISRGGTWPDGGKIAMGATAILADEDGIADTLRPRLDRLDADGTRIFVIKGRRDASGDRLFNFQNDLDALRSMIEAEHVALVIVDPLTAYLGTANTWKDDELRRVLTPLAVVAEKSGAGVLGIVHFNKNQEQNLLHRVGGSVAFTAVPRVVLRATKQDGDQRMLTVLKNNLAPTAPALGYRIVEPGTLVWEATPPTGPAVTEAMLRPTEKASRFLRELLRGGPLPVQEVERKASEAGITASALKRARLHGGIVANRVGSFGDGTWLLSLPCETIPPSTTQGVNLSELDEMGEMAIEVAQVDHVDHVSAPDPGPDSAAAIEVFA